MYIDETGRFRSLCMDMFDLTKGINGKKIQ